MRYIDGKGKKIEIDMNEFYYVNSGNFGKIYRNNVIVLKKYYDSIPECFKIQKAIFDILKDIDSANFIKLYNAYMEDKQHSKNSRMKNKFLIDAYTAKYYQKDYISPALVDKEYILENFNEMEKICKIFQDYSISLHDVKIENTILTKDSIVIIDPDLFTFSDLEKENLIRWNKRKLLELFKQALLEGIGSENIKSMKEWLYDNLKSDDIYKKKQLTSELSKKLQYVKRPIDVIRK